MSTCPLFKPLVVRRWFSCNSPSIPELSSLPLSSLLVKWDSDIHSNMWSVDQPHLKAYWKCRLSGPPQTYWIRICAVIKYPRWFLCTQVLFSSCEMHLIIPSAYCLKSTAPDLGLGRGTSAKHTFTYASTMTSNSKKHYLCSQIINSQLLSKD